jgi:hypothetical protein
MIRLRDWIDVRGVLQEASLRKVAVWQQERTLMNFLITTIGTAGDVLPFVELALALKKRGHHVEFASAEAYRSLVRTAGLPFHTLYAAPQARDIYSPIQGIRVASEERLIPALRPAYELISQLSPIGPLFLRGATRAGARRFSFNYVRCESLRSTKRSRNASHARSADAVLGAARLPPISAPDRSAPLGQCPFGPGEFI